MLYKIKFLLKKILGNKLINHLKLFYTYILFNFNNYNLKKINSKNILYRFPRKSFEIDTFNDYKKDNKNIFHSSNKSEAISFIDQYLIKEIVTELKPKKILEIGTFIGASSLVIGKTLKILNVSFTIDTVDINDVNSKDFKEFINKNYFIDLTPFEIFKKNHIENNINFFTYKSYDFFKMNKNKYDFIFIDGSHQFKDVYDDICNSLKILNKYGLILIHDYYYSKNKVNNKIISYGPYFALKKILNENHNLELLPLKELVHFENTSLVLIQNR